MTHHKPIFLVVLVTASLAFSGLALADGMFIAPRGSFIYEPAQQAIIQYDQDTNTEQLTILPHYYGNASDFAWVVPVPSAVEVSLADSQIFQDLDTMTRAVYQSREREWNCGRSQDIYAAGEGPLDNQIEVISSELVGYYETIVVNSTSASVLVDSLTNWGFLHAENSQAVNAAIGHYVEAGWNFVAMRIDSSAVDASDYLLYHFGGLAPVKFTFVSDEIIYPMRISAVSADQYSLVNVYLITDHRMTVSGAETYYANKFTSGEIAEISHLASLDGLFEPGDFLTKLHRRYTPEQMVDDVVFTRASNDNEFIIIHYSSMPWTGILLFGPAAVWAAIRRKKLIGR